MKKLLIPILLFALASCTKTVEVYTYVNTDNDVLVKKDTTITGNNNNFYLQTLIYK